MSSFIAAGTSYSSHGVNMIPMFIYYSMFGFQRIGDLIWLAADARAKGFLLGGTAGRTTLNGEGLQHQDGHSHLLAATVPTCICYDPAYAYEVAVIVQDGLRRMYEDDQSIFYYLTLYNESYEMPPMPEAAAEGILKGMYRLKGVDVGSDGNERKRPQLFGSGPILREVLRAQDLLAEKYNVSSDVWSVTSYKTLRGEAQAAERWNRLHPQEEPRQSYLEQTLARFDGPFIAASDNMKLVADQIRDWVPGTYRTLGTDGFGRSDTREALRRHFEVDAEQIVLTTLAALAEHCQFEKNRLPQVIEELGLEPDKIDPAVA